MYFTQCALNPDRRSTRDLVSSPQRLHAAVLGCFAPDTARLGRILWRLDAPERHRLDLFLTSPVEPSMESLIDQAGWPNQPLWRTAPYDPFLDRLEASQEWVFRLRANPVASVRSDEGARGSRVSVIKAQRILETRNGTPNGDRMAREDILSAWLSRQGTKHGFQVASGDHGRRLRVTEEDERFSRRTGGEQNRVSLAVASFEGVLSVTDPADLRSALCQGIGPAKSYGCGLMTLARAS